MALWRPADTPRREKPVWQPSTPTEWLTDDEKARLSVYRDTYPLIEWVTLPQLRRLTLERYLWRNGDDR